jgi:2-dehydro-3-deoxy-D-arabinonate dehydratase
MKVGFAERLGEKFLVKVDGAEASRIPGYQSCNELFVKSGGRVSEYIQRVTSSQNRFPLKEVRLLRPYSPPEVWGAGITYMRSKEGHTSEARTLVDGISIYDYVYEAKRPELFFKGTWRNCVGPDEPIGIRGDSKWTLPEPELGVILDSEGNAVGYTVSNDVSARDIEVENPLYLPQSKIYEASCAIGPVIALADEIKDPYSLGITMKIFRGDAIVFEGRANTSALRRKVEELSEYLLSYYTPEPLTLLSTGTSIVPSGRNGLREGDLVEITIDGIGTLRNTARIIQSKKKHIQ